MIPLAHLASTDLGPFYDGLLHALVSPEDLLIILALVVVASHGGRRKGRRLVLALGVSWALGTIGGYAAAKGPFEAPIAVAWVILVLGLIGMSARPVPAALLAGAATVLGLARGFMNGTDAQSVGGPWLSVTGIVTGVFVICILAAGLGSWLAERRAAIALRVAGSWIAAIGLLMAGWQLRG